MAVNPPQNDTQSAAKDTKYKGTLAKPNLEDLWSVAYLPGSKSLAGKVRGGMVLLCLTLSWSMGTLGPFVALWLLYRGQAAGDLAALVAGTLLGGALAWPFVAPVAPWPAAARFWLGAAQYFDGGCSMAFEERSPNDNSVPTMQCYHPHGLFTLGLILNSGVRFSAAAHQPGSSLWQQYCGATGPAPIVGLAAEKLVQMPVFRHIMVLWTGNIESAAKKHMVGKMQRGDSFGLMPGGFHELNLFVQGQERVYVKKQGFIKYALQYGYQVVPAYTFGETSTFWVSPGFEKFKEWAADRGMPAVLLTGPFLMVPFLALLPFGNGGLHTVHGKGRVLPKIAEPTAAQVNEYHQWYVAELEALYERHKGRFGVTAKLDILK